VVLTRPAERQVALARRLQDLGCDVLELPALEIKPLDPNWFNPETSPARFDVVIFVSRAALKHYLAVILARYPGFVWPSNTIVAVVGQSTAHYARQSLGKHARVICPEVAAAQDSESLWPELEPLVGAGVRVLVVRGERGREWLVRRLQEQGASVQVLSVYRREPARWGDQTRSKLSAWVADRCGTGVWLVTSLEGLDAIEKQINSHGIQDVAALGVVVVHDRLIGPVRQWLMSHSELGAQVPISVCSPDEESLLQGLLCLVTTL
jgi:uroporphyrinogen-III synthase